MRAFTPKSLILLFRRGSCVVSNINMAGQARFITRGGIFVQRAFVDRFVDQGNGRIQKILALPAIAGRDGSAEALDRGAKFTAVSTVDKVLFLGLSDSFFS